MKNILIAAFGLWALGHVINDKEAEKLWNRKYEKGGEPKIVV